mgnify:CR=1 FL=1
MAVVTYVKYKSRKNSTPSALKGVIDYCNQPYKTHVEEQIYSINGKDCNGEFAFREFMATKKLYCKSDGIMFYHYVQSFSPEENITPEEANKIGLELAKEFKGFEVLVATHMDREHIHNHLIINSVSFENGYKLRQNPNSLQKLRNRSDEICLQHDKTVLPKYEKISIKGLGTREYRAAEKGQSWKFQLMNAIDKAMNKSGSLVDFVKQMQNIGYEMLWTDTRKYITFTCPNGMKCRDIKLHDEKYLKENLEYELQFRENVFSGQAKTEQRNGDIRDGAATVSPNCLRSQRNTDHLADDAPSGSEQFSTDPLQSDFTAGDTGKYSRLRQSAVEFSDRDDRAVRGKDENGGDGLDQHYEADNCGNEQIGRTGWEESRRIYFENLLRNGQEDNSTLLGGVQTAPPNYANFNRNGIGIGATVGSGLAAASKIIDNDSEDPEERRKRIEAQENGDVLGALVGIAVGLAIGAEVEAEQSEGDSPQMEM